MHFFVVVFAITSTMQKNIFPLIWGVGQLFLFTLEWWSLLGVKAFLFIFSVMFLQDASLEMDPSNQ